jgi:hypothetical protein
MKVTVRSGLAVIHAARVRFARRLPPPAQTSCVGRKSAQHDCDKDGDAFAYCEGRTAVADQNAHLENLKAAQRRLLEERHKLAAEFPKPAKVTAAATGKLRNLIDLQRDLELLDRLIKDEELLAKRKTETKLPPLAIGDIL